jgi:hypothetical protein
MKEARDYPWFNLADYEPRRQFDLRDWAIMLLLRDQLPDYVDRYSQIEDPEFEFKVDEYWLNYLDEALPSKYWSNRSKKQHEGLLADPVLEDITHLALADGFGNRPISTFAIEYCSARLLQVNALAPDAILIRAFKSWLRNLRKRSPLPFGRRGKPGLNLEITPAHLASWTNYNILAVLDLDRYDRVKKRKKLSYRKLFEKFNPEGCQKIDRTPEEWVKEARNKARNALGCLYPLIVQTKFQDQLTP